MQCRHCGSKNTRVTVTDPHENFTKRYCRCLDCQGRFRTIETYEQKKPGPLPGVQRTRNIARGENHGASVFTDKDILLMRYLYDQGQTLQSIANKFGSSRYYVSKIVNRKAWTHI